MTRESETTSRRLYGTGSLFLRHGAWYGKWYSGGRQIKRKLGPSREAGHRDGLTRKRAELHLRKLMESVKAPATTEVVTFERAAQAHMEHLALMGRKNSTLTDYASYLRIHLIPALGPIRIERIGKAEVERFLYRQLGKGLTPKSVRNHMGLLHGVLEFAAKQEWIERNPAKLVEKPKVPRKDESLMFLTLAELDALLRATPDDELGQMERVLYQAAAMIGFRQSEGLGLRWGDIDWIASRIRIQRGVVRGEVSSPKTAKGYRSPPMAHEVAVELQRLYERTLFKADDDPVFCNPRTGKPYDRSKLLKRFKKVRAAAGVKPVTFHQLRHTFGTRCAAAGIPLRTIQEWMGHEDIQTTMIYAHYAPGEQEAAWIAQAFDRGTDSGTNLASSSPNSKQLLPGNPLSSDV